MTDVQTPAGYYPAPDGSGTQWYWDGTQWNAPTPAAAQPMKPKPKKKGIRWWVWALAGVVALLVLIIAIGSANARPAPAAAPVEKRQAVEEPVEDKEPAAPKTVSVKVPAVVGLTVGQARAALEAEGLVGITPGAADDWVVNESVPSMGTAVLEKSQVILKAEAPKPVLSISQQNAVKSGVSYLKYSDFSRTGLIGQLEYEGFSTEDATFAVDFIAPDWNAECAGSAQSYLNTSAFSREGLYDQLAYEGFIDSEIQFGLAAVGY